MELMMMRPGSLFVFSGKFIVLELKKKSLAPGEMSRHYDVIIFLVNPTLVYQMHMNSHLKNDPMWTLSCFFESPLIKATVLICFGKSPCPLKNQTMFWRIYSRTLVAMNGDEWSTQGWEVIHYGKTNYSIVGFGVFMGLLATRKHRITAYPILKKIIKQISNFAYTFHKSVIQYIHAILMSII